MLNAAETVQNHAEFSSAPVPVFWHCIEQSVAVTMPVIHIGTCALHITVRYRRHGAPVMQVLLAPHGSGCGGPAPAGVPQTMWIGGTASQKDSKHRQLQEAVPDSHVRHPHAVRTTTAAFLSCIFDVGVHFLLDESPGKY